MRVRIIGRAYATTLALLGSALPGFAQPVWATNGSYIMISKLPGELAAAMQLMGGRMTSAATATIGLTGTLTDASGTRSVQITVQAPGYLKFQDSYNSRTLMYSGSQWNSKNGLGGEADLRIEESLMAHLPDSFFLQLANGGGIRRIGSRFRTDNGKTPNYAGPYWTLYAFSPSARPGLTWGQPLQQSYLIALDETTRLVSEVRIVLQTSKTTRQVTQTKFSNWIQQGGQSYPGEIVRLENGQQVLKLTVQQGATGSPLAASTFQP